MRKKAAVQEGKNEEEIKQILKEEEEMHQNPARIHIEKYINDKKDNKLSKE
jgi:hypothetical protein